MEKGTSIIKVKYTEVLKNAEQVSERIQEFTDGDYSINIEEAVATIRKPDDFTEFSKA